MSEGGKNPMKSESLQELYLEELRDIYDAEQQLLKVLPRMAKAASHDELQAAFEQHAEQTEEHIARLDQIFEELDEKPKSHKCEAMKGLLEEAKNIMEEFEDDPDVLDAALICAAQKVEHYEIASYGCLRTYAELLGFDDQADSLQDTLDEEKDTDESLTELAISLINVDAADEEDSDEDEDEVEVVDKKKEKAGEGEAAEEEEEDEDEVDEEDEDEEESEGDEEKAPTNKRK
jgi:ferritin-like metal-binding protein YciE